MTADSSSPRQRWLDQYVAIEALQSSIFEVLQEDSEEAIEQLNELIRKQDMEIRQLPFAELSPSDIAELQPKIELLQHNHNQLTQAITGKRQTLLNQSTQSKKAGRSINAYRQAQDF